MLFSSFQKKTIAVQETQLTDPCKYIIINWWNSKQMPPVKCKGNETNLIELFQVVLDRGTVLDGTYCISKLQPRVFCVVLW